MPPALYNAAAVARAGTVWLQWVDVATTGSTSQVWLNWTGTGSVGATASSSVSVWQVWNQGTTYASPQIVHPGTPPSPEELERRRKDAEERARLAAVARGRARALLLAVLDDKQRDELERAGHFHVQTRDGERVYRLAPGSPPRRIKGEDGSQWTYCIHPRDAFPADDTTAALKLMIEAEEQRFLTIANATRVGSVV